MYVKALPTCVAFCTDQGRSVGALFASTQEELPGLFDLAQDILPLIARYMEAGNAANNKPE